jgi:hypothetical protein
MGVGLHFEDPMNRQATFMNVHAQGEGLSVSQICMWTALNRGLSCKTWH